MDVFLNVRCVVGNIPESYDVKPFVVFISVFANVDFVSNPELRSLLVLDVFFLIIFN